MQAALAAAATRQGHVQRLAGQLLRLFGFQDGLAPRLQRLLHGLLDHVDGGAGGRTLFGGQLAQLLQLLGQRAALAEVARLGLLQVDQVAAGGEITRCAGLNLFEILHESGS